MNYRQIGPSEAVAIWRSVDTVALSYVSQSIAHLWRSPVGSMAPSSGVRNITCECCYCLLRDLTRTHYNLWSDHNLSNLMLIIYSMPTFFLRTRCRVWRQNYNAFCFIHKYELLSTCDGVDIEERKKESKQKKKRKKELYTTSVSKSAARNIPITHAV
jgi:hypothetical protein